MKVSYEWEPNDIKPGRIVFSKSGASSLIGYCDDFKKRRFAVIDGLNGRDGWLRLFKSAAALADHLNHYEYQPEKSLRGVAAAE